MNLDAQGQVVLDTNGNPMEVGKYYNIGGFLKNKYLGQWIDAKNVMRFQMPNKTIFRRIYDPLDPLTRAVRIEDPEDAWTDDEDQKDNTFGGRRKTKRRKSKRRKSKRRKTKRRR